MSHGSWRSAEALHKRQVERRAVQRAVERARFKREQEIEEWHITGEPAFRPKERSYPHGGGVEGAAGFLTTAERAIHLHDRGKTLTREMSTTLASLERKRSSLREACQVFRDKHSSHLHPERIHSERWEISNRELQLFVEAAERMSSAQRQAFTNVLAPRRDKAEGYIDPVPPLAASLLRAKNASIEQAVSGALFSSGDRGRFARGVRVGVAALSNTSCLTPGNGDGSDDDAPAVVTSSADGVASSTADSSFPSIAPELADGCSC